MCTLARANCADSHEDRGDRTGAVIGECCQHACRSANPGARADDPEDREDSTTVAPGHGCEHARCVAAPGGHGSQGTANSCGAAVAVPSSADSIH